ncbi:hypothetical protein SAMN04487948_11563 [Halogranum amylolyticum]|uniref:Uncharacterized protein n=1 Tax=Halogranum amylolyticum TaxID=660520 RepID=A0A1H8VC49_9EURY|nr:hypothetical protein [Halogranum amylolyticum]SEP12757.1 hypothetical protein SAMN04487948_11563 [Halogranum amylolyticum]
MTEQLLEEVVGDGDHSFADNEYICDWFIDVGREYVANADDPTTEQVAILVEHFEGTEPAALDDETLALLWTMGSIFRWMLDELLLQGETTDPEWLRQRLQLWSGTVGDDSP